MSFAATARTWRTFCCRLAVLTGPLFALCGPAHAHAVPSRTIRFANVPDSENASTPGVYSKMKCLKLTE